MKSKLILALIVVLAPAALRAIGAVDWPWFWALAPVWFIPALVGAGFFVAAALTAAMTSMAALADWWRPEYRED